MKRRTKVYQLRLTPEEQSTLKEKAKGKPVADYIRAALTEYSDTDARHRLELINNLGEFYRKFRDELSWAGSNLNQSVKRANELVVAGLLPPSYIREVLMPVILETQKTLNEIKRNLETVTRKAVKLKFMSFPIPYYISRYTGIKESRYRVTTVTLYQNTIVTLSKDKHSQV